uniref:Zcchc14 protein n=1 Tax=Mus musculus TaxID=10090 RepID=Q99J16_MOUSE|nr:Zcchc14 protein [Mus musculus]
MIISKDDSSWPLSTALSSFRVELMRLPVVSAGQPGLYHTPCTCAMTVL